MKTLCGIDCGGCSQRKSCRGCSETCGDPFGGGCVAAECIKAGGFGRFEEFKARVMREANALGIDGMPEVTELFQLCGAQVNLRYPLPGGRETKFLDDKRIYVGCQLDKPGSERCFGLVADERYMLVCEYGRGGCEPEIIVFKRR